MALHLDKEQRTVVDIIKLHTVVFVRQTYLNVDTYMNAHTCLFHAHVFCSRYMRECACVRGKGKWEREIKSKQRERKKAGKKKLWQEGQKGRVGAGEVDEGWTPEVVKLPCEGGIIALCTKDYKRTCSQPYKKHKHRPTDDTTTDTQCMDEKIVKLTQTKEQTTKTRTTACSALCRPVEVSHMACSSHSAY